MLFSEPKIPQWLIGSFSTQAACVSVLFSEPKIPQCAAPRTARAHRAGFSALQRAENSSIFSFFRWAYNRPSFQCSSASRKFLNDGDGLGALRADDVSVLFSEPKIPQSTTSNSNTNTSSCFSALQRAENSSIDRDRADHAVRRAAVSVLFSEPKIPQSGVYTRTVARTRVSVLFSEPKIPQCRRFAAEWRSV